MSGDLKLLRIGVRMLMDYLKIMEDEQTEFEVGCKCKDEEVCARLRDLMKNTLAGFPVKVGVKGKLIVVLCPPEFSPVNPESDDLPGNSSDESPGTDDPPTEDVRADQGDAAKATD